MLKYQSVSRHGQTAVETVTVSDLYDLDTLFAEAKTQGLYEEYETVDDLLAAK